MVDSNYPEMVASLERALAPYAKRSFETQSPLFVDGSEVFSYFMDRSQANEAKYKQRTPIQIERDRILYSPGMRKLTEKYHVLYNGRRRIVRSFATHTMKMAQVARAIARGLDLNQDFTEAVALGAKVGAVPFVHASKSELSEWALKKLSALDASDQSNNSVGNNELGQLNMDFGQKAMPKFITNLKSASVLNRVRKYMPWAAGGTDCSLYGSGQEGYWLLCTNPFTNETRGAQYLPETMYGIWRHTRGIMPGADPFHHRCNLEGPKRGYHEITDSHATFEAIVVQYADDITWVIENLSDANEVALLNDQLSVFSKVENTLGPNVDSGLQRALTKNDTGSIYSYFINDFVVHSQSVINPTIGGSELRRELSIGNRNIQIGLSQEASLILERMIKYLNERVFIEPRTSNRTEMLRSMSRACVDLIYSGDVLERVVIEQSQLGGWGEDTREKAIKLLDDDIHKTQASIDVLASWGDQEIFDFVGIQSL